MAALRMMRAIMGRMVLMMRWSHITYTLAIDHTQCLAKIYSLNLDIGRIIPEVGKYNSGYEGRLPHQVEGVVDDLELQAVLPISYQVPAGANVPDGHRGVENVEGIVRRDPHQAGGGEVGSKCLK
jgi:hypothetical protein